MLEIARRTVAETDSGDWEVGQWVHIAPPIAIDEDAMKQLTRECKNCCTPPVSAALESNEVAGTATGVWLSARYPSRAGAAAEGTGKGFDASVASVVELLRQRWPQIG